MHMQIVYSYEYAHTNKVFEGGFCLCCEDGCGQKQFPREFMILSVRQLSMGLLVCLSCIGF
jgi:hypothetical protein